MRCVGQPHKRLAGLIVARTSKSRRKGSSNWKVSEDGVCRRVYGTDGTHETDGANGTYRPDGPWEPSPGFFSLGFRFSPWAGVRRTEKPHQPRAVRSQQAFTETRSVIVSKSSPRW